MITRAMLASLVTAVAFGGTIYTQTDCNTASGCTTTKTYADFGQTFSITNSLSSMIVGPPNAPPGYQTTQSKTRETIIFTADPPRPGYLDLSYGGTADGDRIPGYFANGNVSGLYSWNCFAVGCTNHVFIPITLGGQFDITISVGSVWFKPPTGFIQSGFGQTGYTLQLREGSPTGPPVALSSAPEPAGQALLGLLLLTGAGLWRFRGNARSRP